MNYLVTIVLLLTTLNLFSQEHLISDSITLYKYYDKDSITVFLETTPRNEGFIFIERLEDTLSNQRFKQREILIEILRFKLESAINIVYDYDGVFVLYDNTLGDTYKISKDSNNYLSVIHINQSQNYLQQNFMSKQDIVRLLYNNLLYQEKIK